MDVAPDFGVETLARHDHHRRQPAPQRVGAHGQAHPSLLLQAHDGADVFVQPGDSLLLEPTVPGALPVVPTDQIVAADGTIDLGVYGRVRVAGSTVEEIEDRVRTAICDLDPGACDPPEDLPEDPGDRAVVLARATRGPVNVRLIAVDSLVFYALGEVAAPGAYPLDGRETVLDAILEAGGLSDRANRCEIILARPTGPGECRVVLRVCYDRLVQLGDTTTNYQVLPGDRIFVASKTCGESFREVVQFWKEPGCPQCCDTGSCPCPGPTGPEAIRRPFLPVPSFIPAMLGLPSRPAVLPPAEMTDDLTDDASDDDASSEDELDLPGPPDEPDETTDDAADDADADSADEASDDPTGIEMLDLSEPSAKPDADAKPVTSPPTITLPKIDASSGGNKR